MDSGAGDPTSRLYLDRSADIVRTVENLVAKNRVDALHTLAVALDAEADDLRTRLNRAEVALNHLAFSLAETRGEEYVESLLRLLPNRPFLYKRLRPLAAALAAHQNPDILLQLAARYLLSNEYMQAVGEYYHIELLSLLVHEMIVRGVDVQQMPNITLLHNKMRGRRHPLAWLPMCLTELEASLRAYLPAGDDDVFSLPPMAAVEVQEAGDLHPDLQPMLPLGLPPPPRPLPAAKETTRTYTSEPMKLAVASWFNMEARTFTLEPAMTETGPLARLLLSLGLECLERAGEEALKLKSTTPNHVLARLFAVASTGGPHEAYEGAYGRLYAWQTLGALAGASPDASLDEVTAQASQCRWFHFDAETDWFYQVGWDVGLVALRPGGDTLAVLAATATD